MNKREHKPISKKELKSRLEEMSKALLASFDEGLVDVTIAMDRSAVEVTSLADTYRKYEPGPTLKVSINMHNPKEDRPEEWNKA